jgi:ATP phosphoribosyltransferase-like protein
VVLNVSKDNLQKVVDLLPGVKSPTVVPLFEPDWVAVHSVIAEEDFWDKINSLKAAGAPGSVSRKKPPQPTSLFGRMAQVCHFPFHGHN